MYDILLIIHNWFRWVVLILGFIAVINAFFGWLSRRAWVKRDRTLGSLFGITLDIQLLFGIILYFISPIVQSALSDLRGAMGTEELRFFSLEHLFYMVIAVVAVHLGSILSRRAQTDIVKHRRAALWYLFTIAIILIGIPWWRPLFRV